jgi:hypothetical protein
MDRASWAGTISTHRSELLPSAAQKAEFVSR